MRNTILITRISATKDDVVFNYVSAMKYKNMLLQRCYNTLRTGNFLLGFTSLLDGVNVLIEDCTMISAFT